MSSVTERVGLFEILQTYLRDPEDVDKIQLVRDAQGKLWLEWRRVI